MTELETFLERAAQAESEAETAVLSNVRERHLLAARTWRAMAKRLRVHITMRENLLAEKEAAKAAATQDEDDDEPALRLFGHIKAFDRETGLGVITGEATKEDFPFDRFQIRWDKPGGPDTNKRYSFEIRTEDGVRNAVDLRVP